MVFDNNNNLFIPEKKVKILIKEETEDNYTITLYLKGRIILSKKNIKGISKVFYDQDFLGFSIFTYTDEDDNNQGLGYVVNLKNGRINHLSKKLSKTCNPVLIGNNIFFVDDLSLIKTDLNLKIINVLGIKYRNKNKEIELNSLDTYGIFSLSTLRSEYLLINYSPDKFHSNSNFYSGKIENSSRFIILN